MGIQNKAIHELENFRNSFNRRVENFGPQYIAFGIFGLLNYPIFYLIWKYLSLQSYENLWLRLIASLLCIPLIFKNYWSRKLQHWLPLYWYVTLLFCLPFFFCFMLLKNQASEVWLMSTTVVLVWLMLLVDGLSFIILLMLGILIAFLTFHLTSSTYFIKENFFGLVAQYLGSLLVVLIFAHNRERSDQEKLTSMKTLAATIAHELRTPLRAIDSGAAALQDYLPTLLKSYEYAVQHNLMEPTIVPAVYRSLKTTCAGMEMEIQASFTFINMMLANIKENLAFDTEKFALCKICHCVEEALQRYPFSETERKLVAWKPDNDFVFVGDKIMMVHLLFNLIKNALYYIHAVNKGTMAIWVEIGSRFNELHFKDTSKGIPAKVLPYVFDRFYSKTYHGTGLGLAFCKTAMEAMGGKIKCFSEEGKYTEFVLYFPTHKK